MYEAKSERADHIHLVQARLSNGNIVDCTDQDPPAEPVEEEQA